VAEGLHVANALCEQVADPARAVTEELERVAPLDVLREHQHRGLGQLGADAQRGAQTVVGVARRHADVGEHEVGAVLVGVCDEGVGVARGHDHGHAGPDQQHDLAGPAPARIWRR
jgi:hypothetical protein